MIIIVGFAIYKNAETQQRHSISRWNATENLIEARRSHAATAANGFIYTIGGLDNNDRYISETEYSQIRSNGALKQWQSTSALLQPRFYLAASNYQKRVYAIGGAIGELGKNNLPVATVESAPILADGRLGEWRREADMLTPRRALTVERYENWIYAIGGYNGIFLKSIERAKIEDDGRITQWQLISEHAQVDRYIHSSALIQNTLFLLGGHVEKDDKLSYGDVELAHINHEGDLSPWQIAPVSLSQARFLAQAVGVNNTLFIIGGHDGTRRLKTVEYAHFDDIKELTSWRPSANLKIERSAAASAEYNGFIYMIGGSGTTTLNSVEYATPF